MMTLQPAPQSPGREAVHLVLGGKLLQELQGDDAVQAAEHAQKRRVIDLHDRQQLVQLGGPLLDQSHAILAGDAQGHDLGRVRPQRSEVLMQRREPNGQGLAVDAVGLVVAVSCAEERGRRSSLGGPGPRRNRRESQDLNEPAVPGLRSNILMDLFRESPP